MLPINRGHSSARYIPRHRAERTGHTGAALRRGAAGAVAGLALATGAGAISPANAAQLGQDDDNARPDGPSNGSMVSMSKDNLPDLSTGLGSVLRIAASKAGTPYVYGATGPSAFDCSGFTQWVFNRVGKSLPRTAAAQAGAVRRISADDARPGDLVFFTGSGGVYHVGIYAGGGAIWHAPRPGEGVRREQIWTSSVFYGRP